jgi:AraC family transcriptional regulator
MLILDLAQEDSVVRILPQPPVIASYPSHWEDIYVQYHRQPAWITPEFSSSLHLIIVNQSDRSLQFEQVIKGFKEKCRLNRGEIVIFPANILFQASWDTQMEFIMLLLEPNYLDRLAGKYLTHRVTIEPCLAVENKAIATIATLFQQELESEQISSDVWVEAMKEILALTLLREYATQSAPEPLRDNLQIAIAYIQDHLSENLSLQQLAAIAKISPYYFARCFKQSTGVTVNQYVTERRMKKARELLQETELTVVEVAKLVGINSQSHFNRVFRQHTGSTPKVYRDRRAKKQDPAGF